MSDFEYSTEALNAKSAFLRVQTLVYVEGDDDVPFWHEIFSHVPNFEYVIEPRGCSKDLDKYIALIESGELNAIAARDSDYIKFSGSASSCSKVIYTFGYSIENTLYTSRAVSYLSRIWCKNPTLPSINFKNWLSEFSMEFANLLACDIANSKMESGLQVLHDNCSQFMKGKTSCSPCRQKIEERLEQVSERISAEMVNDIREKVGDDSEQIALTIRGHFLASAIAKYIQKEARLHNKKISFSGEGLYASALAYLSGNFGEKHPHYGYYSKSAKGAAANF